MGDLAIWTVDYSRCMVGFPILMVAILSQTPSHPHFHYRLKLNGVVLYWDCSFREAFFALMGYPVVVGLLIGARNFLDMPR